MDPSLFRYAWRHSRLEQIVLLGAILLSLPFYWVSLEVPKLIVNNAIQGHAFQNGHTTAVLFDWSVSLPDFLGGASFEISKGIALERMPYLFVSSIWFLVLTLINGGFKYYINIQKGILGERMLRRMRADLFGLLLRFRPEDIAAVKPAEVASMIKDEVDPIGGFIGDAFIQPVFLGSQALTALIFIIAQSAWMGAAALAIVLIQALVIPYLRREQLRLGRLRQVESRRLAGRIGDVVEAAPTVHAFGASAYMAAEIDTRLKTLFGIRTSLFRRKFAVKFLNNLLAQVTPFIFYCFGGYFALQGSLNIGQLVAVISAYRDLPPPIKELIDWDQQRQDVAIKYEQVVSQFSPAMLLPAHDPAQGQPFPSGAMTIELTGVAVTDARGVRSLERLSLALNLPSHIALIGEHGGGQDVLLKLLGRQSLNYRGTIRIGGHDIGAFSEPEFTRHVLYVGPESQFQAGSLRHNMLFAARRRHRPGEAEDFHDSWLDCEAMGISSRDQIDEALLQALDAVGGLEDIYKLGIRARFDDKVSEGLKAAFVEARRQVHQRLEQLGLARLVESFHPLRYNANATIGENLLFGIPVGERLAADGLARDSYTRSILEAEGLLKPLIDIGRRIAEMALETFGGLPPEHPVFERYAFIDPNELDSLRDIVESLDHRRGATGVSAAARTRLLSLAFAYVEPRHRLGVLSPAFRDRLLRARASFRSFLPIDYHDEIEFYERGQYMVAAPVVDNLLFGRIDAAYGTAVKKIYRVMREVLADCDLDRHVYGLGLDCDVGKGGRLLQPAQRVKIGLARALVAHPALLIVDRTLGPLPPAEAAEVLAGLRRAMAGKGLIISLSPDLDPHGFDRVLQFDGNRLVIQDQSLTGNVISA